MKAKNAVNTAVSQAWPMRWSNGGDAGLWCVLTGGGGSFCAGMDLKAFARGENVVVRPWLYRTSATTKPLIAAVEGYALAGGTELALAADLIVAARDSAFRIPEVKRVWLPGGGSCCGCRASRMR